MTRHERIFLLKASTVGAPGALTSTEYLNLVTLPVGVVGVARRPLASSIAWEALDDFEKR
jgi:hypothetical protein